MAYLPDQKSLLDQFEPSNVPDELGGSLKYDHKSWVYNRLVSFVNSYSILLYLCNLTPLSLHNYNFCQI